MVTTVSQQGGNTSTLTFELFGENHTYICIVSLFLMTCLFYNVNTDDVVMQRARASVATILTLFSQSMLGLVQEW